MDLSHHMLMQMKRRLGKQGKETQDLALAAEGV
jgi:hypothetical protein